MAQPGGGGGGGGGDGGGGVAYSFISCLGHVTVDRASRSRRSKVLVLKGGGEGNRECCRLCRVGFGEVGSLVTHVVLPFRGKRCSTEAST